MTLDLEPGVTLPWLVRLRWAFLAGQLAIAPLMHAWFALAIDTGVLAIQLGLMAVSNIALVVIQRRDRSARVVGGVMIVDTLLLTLYLYACGGSANPFTVLYLVHIALSAIVLSTWWTAGIIALSLAGFAALFVGTSPHAMMHHDGFAQHLQAMWAAFFIAAGLIAFFVSRVTRAIVDQREQIARLRETNERHARLASITHLAANAAHELGSPLSTIAVSAHEAMRHLEAPGARSVREDLELIMQEVERCQAILSRMSSHDAADDGDSVTLGDLSNRVRDYLGEHHSARLELHVAEPDAAVSVPAEQLAGSVAALVKNGLEASDDRVRVVFETDPAALRIEVVDSGPGIADDVLVQIGRPFFTTKGGGRGLGLGVFLARAFFESQGGSLAIHSTAGVGTSAVVQLPRVS